MNRVCFAALAGVILWGATAGAAEPRPYLLAYNRTNLAATLRNGGSDGWGGGCGCEVSGGGCGCESRGGWGCAPQRRCAALWEPCATRCGMRRSCCGIPLIDGLLQE
ncbi:MAG: hypothetical protein AB7F89_19045, partial [Pirellulaceae bacterium]